MKRIRERGIEQIMITDAPGGQASERLHSSRLGKNISRIYAMPTADLPDLPSGFRRHKSSIPLYDLKREKPHVDLEEIFEKTREKIGRTVVIVGDNESKDMELARRYGCIGVHARYGVARAELVERIRKFAPDRVARRSMQLEGDGGVGAANDRIYNVDDPLEILQLVG
jgi:FMN phosphatase YigB (HAD superfamily)